MFDKLGLRHRFFLPLWRRIATVGVIAVWAGLEIWGGNLGWAAVAAGLGLLCAYEFFLLFDAKNYGEDDG